MNPPLPNHYDPENAAQLVSLAAQSYLPDRPDVSDQSTDTHAAISELSMDVVVAFRGTADLRNWLTDLDWKKVPLCWSAGKVHRGFNLALESIAEKLDAAIDPDDQRRIWVTGHSLGGALAMLFALRLKIRRGVNVAGVYTFGQPRVGNVAFSLACDAALKSCTHRVVHADDLIPRVPWLLGNYRHAGHEVFYQGRAATRLAAGRRTECEPYHCDPSWWSRLPNDLRNLTREFLDHQFAPLADHHVSKYQALFSGPEIPATVKPPQPRCLPRILSGLWKI